MLEIDIDMLDINRLRSAVSHNKTEREEEKQMILRSKEQREAKREAARKALAEAFVATVVVTEFGVSSLMKHDIDPPKDTSKYVEELLLEAGFKVRRLCGGVLTVSLPPESTESASSSEGGV